MKKTISFIAWLLLAIVLKSQNTFFTLELTNTAIASGVIQLNNGNYFYCDHGYGYGVRDSLGHLAWAKQNGSALLYFDAQAARQCSDGNIIMGGIINNTNLFISAGTLVKTDTLGNLIWVKRTGYETTGSYTFSGIEETADSGFVIAGGYSSVNTGSNRRSALAMRTDKNGNLAWSKVIVPDTNTHFYTSAVSVKVAPNGDFVFGGFCDYAIMLCRIDPSGNLLWIKTYDLFEMGESVYIDIASDGGIIACTNSDFNSDNNAQAVLLKTDSAGNMQWCNVYGSNGQTDVKCVRTTHDGGFAFLGRENTFPYPGSAIVKTDINGAIEWTAKYDSLLVWDVHKWSKQEFSQTADGGYVFCAGVYYSSGNPMDICFVKTDPNGAAACIGHPFSLTSSPYTPVVVTGGYLVSGETLSAGSIQITNMAGNDSLACSGSFAPNPKSVDEMDKAFSFGLFPALTSSAIRVNLPAESRFEIFSTDGRLLFSKILPAGETFIDLSGFSSGMYIAAASGAAGSGSRKFIRE